MSSAIANLQPPIAAGADVVIEGIVPAVAVPSAMLCPHCEFQRGQNNIFCFVGQMGWVVSVIQQIKFNWNFHPSKRTNPGIEKQIWVKWRVQIAP
jgi:hypothetical protein